MVFSESDPGSRGNRATGSGDLYDQRTAEVTGGEGYQNSEINNIVRMINI